MSRAAALICLLAVPCAAFDAWIPEPSEEASELQLQILPPMNEDPDFRVRVGSSFGGRFIPFAGARVTVSIKSRAKRRIPWKDLELVTGADGIARFPAGPILREETDPLRPRLLARAQAGRKTLRAEFEVPRWTATRHLMDRQRFLEAKANWHLLQGDAARALALARKADASHWVAELRASTPAAGGWQDPCLFARIYDVGGAKARAAREYARCGEVFRQPMGLMAERLKRAAQLSRESGWAPISPEAWRAQMEGDRSARGKRWGDANRSYMEAARQAPWWPEPYFMLAQIYHYFAAYSRFRNRNNIHEGLFWSSMCLHVCDPRDARRAGLQRHVDELSRYESATAAVIFKWEPLDPRSHQAQESLDYLKKGLFEDARVALDRGAPDLAWLKFLEREEIDPQPLPTKPPAVEPGLDAMPVADASRCGAVAWSGPTSLDIYSQYRCGLLYLYGLKGLPRDARNAAKFLRYAAERGHAGAQSRLGRMLEDGEGLPRDPAAALGWYKKAASGYAEPKGN